MAEPRRNLDAIVQVPRFRRYGTDGRTSRQVNPRHLRGFSACSQQRPSRRETLISYKMDSAAEAW